MASETCLGVIPARLKSTRLPDKPLKLIGGKTLLERVWRRAVQATRVTKVVIATDEEQILAHARSFGAEAIMTSDKHLTGSDRVAEVSEIFKKRGEKFSLVANIQGDMPFINPEVIDRTIACLTSGGQAFGMSTVATPIEDKEEFLRNSVVKVALGNNGEALYFSRAPIPFWRSPEEVNISSAEPCGYRHLGLYVFRPEALVKLASLPQSLPEKREKLEQLRALCGGIGIRVEIAENKLINPSVEVDTPEDLARANEIAASLGES